MLNLTKPLEEQKHLYSVKKAFHLIQIVSEVKLSKHIEIYLDIKITRGSKVLFEERFTSVYEHHAETDRINLIEKRCNNDLVGPFDGLDVCLIPYLSFMKSYPANLVHTKKDYSVDIIEKGCEKEIVWQGKKAFFTFEDNGPLAKISLKVPVLGNIELNRG